MLREVGAIPNYGGAPPGAESPPGQPYDDPMTQLMVRKIWTDVRKGRVRLRMQTLSNRISH